MQQTDRMNRAETHLAKAGIHTRTAKEQNKELERANRSMFTPSWRPSKKKALIAEEETLERDLLGQREVQEVNDHALTSKRLLRDAATGSAGRMLGEMSAAEEA